MSHHPDFRFKFTRFGCRVLILPWVLIGASFAQTPDAGMKEHAPIHFVSMFSADIDVNGSRRTPCQHFRDVLHPSETGPGLTAERSTKCDQALNIVAGNANPSDADNTKPIMGAKFVVDNRLRVLITEPTTQRVHILDFANRKYSHIDVTRGDRMSFPYAIAVDAENSIYITDLKRGRIAIYTAEGKFIKYIGDFKGEGLFENPRSIAIDRASGRIYLADTTRNFILILDHDGKTLAQIGKRGGGNGPAQFNEPTEIAVYENEVFVLDRQNARIQVLNPDGNFRRQFKLAGAGARDANGMAFDSQGRLFVPGLNWVEVFNRQGQLLFRFGQSGDQPGEFQMPQDVCADSKDRLYVMDSGNRRIQVFQLKNQPTKTEAAR